MRHFLIVSALVLCLAVTAYAETNAVSVDEVTVTATRTPRKVQEVTTSIENVSKADIANSRGWNMGETLEALPGIQAESKNGAYDTHIIIRGAGTKAAYGIREIMIMVDGIPVTDPDSLSRLDMVDPSMVEKIEVVKGPNSTLYGANASGGVINIITKNPLESQGLNLKVARGSYKSEEYHVQYGGSAGDLSYVLGATRRATDSWRPQNKFETNQFNTRLAYIIDDTSDIDMTLSYTEADLQLPGTLTRAEFYANPTQVCTDWPNMARNSESMRMGLGFRKDLSAQNELTTKLYAQKWEHYHPVVIGINDGGAELFGADVQDNYTSTFMGMKSQLSLGLSLQQDDADSDKYAYRDLNKGVVNMKAVAIKPYTFSDAKGALMETSSNTVDKWGVFVQESLWLASATVLDIGVRYDEVGFDMLTDVYKEWSFVTAKSGVSYFNYLNARKTIDFEKRWTAVSPRVGINQELTKGLNLFGSVSTGFQTPAQSELTTNRDLDPQETVNYELGLIGKSEAGSTLNVTLFYTDIENEIIKLMDAAGVTYYGNAGSTLHQGLELAGSMRLGYGFSASAGYAYSDFTFNEYREMERAGTPPVLITNIRDGNQLPLVPRHKYNASINYRHPGGFYAQVSGDRWGSYYVDTANTETYEGFTVFNARAGYDFKNYGLYIDARNILDKTYAAEVTKSYSETRYSTGSPRTIMAGLTYRM